MDALALLRRARKAGLCIESAGDKLLVRGPKNAEPVVRILAQHKAQVLAALALNENEPSYWKQQYTARTFEWFNGQREWDAARRIAWGDLQNEWHKLHGRRWPAWQCAGCEKPIGGAVAIDLPDDNRVHLEPIDCLIEFGRHWRGKADTALIALGLEAPNAGDG